MGCSTKRAEFENVRPPLFLRWFESIPRIKVKIMAGSVHKINGCTLQWVFDDKIRMERSGKVVFTNTAGRKIIREFVKSKGLVQYSLFD